MKINIRENIINLVMFLYILSLYLFTYQEGLNRISNIIAALLVGGIWLDIILRNKKMIINSFIVLYFIFIIICLFSSLYAIDTNTAIVKTATLSALFVLMISFINYIDTFHKLHVLMKCFVYSGFITSAYILFVSDFSNLTRFGGELGNVNAIGMILVISSTFCFYFIIEEKVYKFIPILLINSIVIFLTGSRKSLVFLTFTLVVLVLSATKRKRFIGNRIKTLIIGLVIVALVSYITFNVPIFYQIIGRRMENLIDFVLGRGTSEGSVNMRSLMAKLGWDWFKERPFFGYGINNYRFLLGQEIGWATYAHNNIIELLVGIGMFGTIVYYMAQIFIIGSLKKASKRISKPLAYVFIAIILGYMFMSVALIYYDSKQFCIILASGSIVSRLYKKKETNIEENNRKKGEND